MTTQPTPTIPPAAGGAAETPWYRRLRVSGLVEWRDLWIGAFVDTEKQRLYVMCLGFGLVVSWDERPLPVPPADPGAAREWSFLFAVPGGHRYFRRGDGRVAVLDDGPSSPDADPDNILYVRTGDPVLFGRDAVSVAVEDDGGVRAQVLESPAGGLLVANLLEMEAKPTLEPIRRFVLTTDPNAPGGDF